MKGVDALDIQITVLPEYVRPHLEIKTAKVTPEVERVIGFVESTLSETDFILTTRNGIERIEKKDVTLVRTEVGKVVLYVEDGTWHEVRMTLTELEEILGEGFVRISKSAVVNLAFVKSVRASFGGTLDLYLKNGLEEVISRNYRKSFKSKLGV